MGSLRVHDSLVKMRALYSGSASGRTDACIYGDLSVEFSFALLKHVLLAVEDQSSPWSTGHVTLTLCIFWEKVYIHRKEEQNVCAPAFIDKYWQPARINYLAGSFCHTR